MPSKTIFISSMSGEEIADGQAAKVRISRGDGKYFEADLTASEATALVDSIKAEEKTARGRKPKAK